MADRPILFSAPMVRALLSGIKTQTRRLLAPHIIRYGEFDGPGLYNPTIIIKGEEAPGPETYGIWAKDGEWASKLLPIRPADRLWVREAWRPGYGAEGWREELGRIARPADFDSKTTAIEYLADGTFELAGKNRPGIHMPRWASRLTLTVTEVRVERLQAISEADAIEEGLTPAGIAGWVVPELGDDRASLDPVAVYRDLWEHINGAGSWAINPFVAAYTFTVEHANIDALANRPVCAEGSSK
jgi:hypothetical protein